MDPHYDAQDVARCDLCEVAIVQSYCDFCHVNLCKPCIGEHISDDYTKHIIVPFQQRRSTPIYPKCEKHPKKTCKLQCKDCQIFLCTDCLASEQHNKEHKLSKLEEVFHQKKDHIHRDKKELKEELLPVYEEIATEITNQIANLDVDYQKFTTQMSKHREELHREIDNAMDQREKEIDENKLKHLSILTKHLEEIKQLQSLMQESLHNLNEMEDSNEVTPTIHYSSKNQEFSKLPPKVIVSMPIFIPKPIYKKEEICSLIGKLTPLSTTLEERVFTAKKPNTSVRELLDEPEVLNTIKTGHEYLRSVTCLYEEEIWTSGRTADFKCFNTQGVLQKTTKTKSGDWPNDIAVYSDGALVYSDGTTRTVYKVKNDQTEEIIRLQGWTPTQLCVTSSGDLLVTMFSDDKTQSKVVRYSGSTVKQTIQFDDDGQPLYSGNDNSKYITENRNLDICVADSGAGAVVVVNQAGKLRFRYTGPPSSTKKESFKPFGITIDSQSRILTSDSYNRCIHVLDVNGQFLCYIDNCDLECPTGLCVDNDDSLFVCEGVKENVRKIRYLE
uniref:Tripartite motif-containing protein 2-like isoform X3 n=1 Tax=Crassostrea virginica TaxID=6565 RepID=A0A8B8AFB4_CRAVI|nr:tripartite motif-containing protein 2-like isoform X3 [Crassostrea virginica]